MHCFIFQVGTHGTLRGISTSGRGLRILSLWLSRHLGLRLLLWLLLGLLRHLILSAGITKPLAVLINILHLISAFWTCAHFITFYLYNYPWPILTRNNGKINQFYKDKLFHLYMPIP
jgi:hypothetical protein